jgi:hypothetical protein
MTNILRFDLLFLVPLSKGWRLNAPLTAFTGRPGPFFLSIGIEELTNFGNFFVTIDIDIECSQQSVST